MNIDPVIATILRLALGWLFLAAAAHKLKDMADFRAVLATYRVLPERVVRVAAACVVAIEIVIGIGALWQYPLAFVGASVALLGYAGAMSVNLARGRRFIDCGCGGAQQPLSVGLVLRNVALAAAALVALIPESQRQLGWLDVVSMLAGVLVLALIYAAANQVLAARARLEEWV